MGVSKQALHQQQNRQTQTQSEAFALLEALIDLRLRNPGLGLKKCYLKLKPPGWGRDRFLALAKQHGLTVKVKLAGHRTTFAAPQARYPNLLGQRELDGINQVWVSDITYLRSGDRFFYLTFLMDVYSRKIIGYSASETLHAEVSVMQALQCALQTRRIKDYQNQLIHHSDRGSQYIYTPYLNTLRQHQIQISMCQMVLENAHAERVNGTIKNEYLHYWNIQTFEQAQRYLAKAVQAYNQDRPHQSLGFLCPEEFEKKLLDTPLDRRTKLRIFTEKTKPVP